MKRVLITGAGGQLGQCFREAVSYEQEIDWIFKDSSQLDITSREDLEDVFQAQQIDYCINCAAYTNVERAESQPEAAFRINAEAVKNLAAACERNKTILFHFSTDYVFDGSSPLPYKETDEPGPLNVYGASKWRGEEYIREVCQHYFIFRTSWLYSRYGHNFYKTILRKAGQGAELNITTSQVGTPTNAHQLSRFIVDLIKKGTTHFGTYHFSNEGRTTWYEFARKILQVSGQLNKAKLKEDNNYKTIAKRPLFSVLDTSRLNKTFDVTPTSWEEALKEV